MDTSKQYIAMCEAADEIQDYFGDSDNRIGNPVYFYQYPGGNLRSQRWEVYERIGLTYDEDYASERTKAVWLPSQDQLQGLCKDHLTLEEERGGARRTTHLIYEFYTFVFGEQFASFEDKAPAMEYSLIFKSMEQLWLGFVMQEEYGKHWDGEKWIKQINKFKSLKTK